MSGGSYYVPANSRWPILGSLALGAMMAGIGIKLVYNTGAPLLVIGLLCPESVKPAPTLSLSPPASTF